MIAAPAVTIVLNGAIVAGSAPAAIVAGRIVAPLRPVVVRLADRIAYVPRAGTVLIARGGRRIVVPVAFVAHGTPYVALAAAVRGLGGDVVFDPATKTLAIAFPSGQPIATPVPYDPRAPEVAPNAVFTPTTRPEPPRPIDTGVPRPRRTAIPVTPSQPQPAEPSTRSPATGRRR